MVGVLVIFLPKNEPETMSLQDCLKVFEPFLEKETIFWYTLPVANKVAKVIAGVQSGLSFLFPAVCGKGARGGGEGEVHIFRYSGRFVSIS